MMTNQEIFDKVAKHLLTQKVISVDEEGRGAYRGKNGLKCAIGVLIPDELYDPAIENHTADDRVVAGILSICGVDIGSYNKHSGCYSDGQMQLLYLLQCIHDISLPDKWRDDLSRMASHYGLSSKILEEI